MIITLSDEFDQIDKSQWASFIPAIENLLTAHLNGWHLLVLSREVIKTLVEIDELSARHKAVIEFYIGERLPTLAGQAAAVSQKIVCTMEEEAAERQAGGFIHVPLKIFEDIENCFRSVLVVENASADAKFYVGLAKILSASGSMSLPLAFDYANGGGSTTAAVVRDLTQRPRPVLVVVDSDKGHPADREGDTARQVRAEFQGQHIRATHSLIVIPVRAAENLVPPILGVDVLSGRAQSVEVCAALAKLEREEEESGLQPLRSAIPYFHVKSGMKVGTFRKGDEVFKKSAVSIAASLGIEIDEPAHNDNSRDNDLILPGVNKKFLEHFVEALENEEFAEKCKDIFRVNRLHSVLKGVIDQVVAYGVNGGRIPISLSKVA